MEIFRLVNPTKVIQEQKDSAARIMEELDRGEIVSSEASRRINQIHYMQPISLIQLTPEKVLVLNPFWRNPDKAPEPPNSYWDAHSRSDNG